MICMLIYYINNIIVENCKEKWRNLRTVFVRKLKPMSGSGRKGNKIYYMTDHMQFILPHIRGVSNVNNPGNISSPPTLLQNESINEIDEIDTKELDINEPTSVSSGYFETTTSNKQVYNPLLKKKKTNNLDLTDKCFISYINTKKHNLKQEENPRKQFLLSMLPDVNQMTEVQMRKFKRKMLDVIDDILEEPS